MKQKTLQSIVETVLFANGDPVAIDRLAEVLEVELSEVESAIDDLTKKYNLPESGLALVVKDASVQLVTRPDNAEYVEKLLRIATQETLSKAALEVLSVIAYRGPISRTDIEAIRGVNCSVTLRNLLMRELIERKTSSEDAREYLYTISFEFLKSIGLGSVSEMPNYDMLSKDERADAMIQKSASENNNND